MTTISGTQQPHEASKSAARTITLASDARRAGARAAHQLITTRAEAGLNAEQIEVSVEDALAGRYDECPLMPDAFYAALDETAAIYLADLRELEAE